MTIWTYNGREVRVSPVADIPNALQMGSKYERLVQRALRSVPPWEEGESPHVTVRVRPLLWEPVVLNNGRMPKWGIYIGHRFEQVDVSPFLQLPKGEDAPTTHALTIEMSGTPDHPVIERAYAGQYLPPLPWEHKANWEDGGIAACATFWRLYSRVYRPKLIKGELRSDPPEWFIP